MTKLEEVLKELPHKKTARLKGGLGLRYMEGPGLIVLSCSRINQPPSETELKTVAAAVRATFAPKVIFADLHIDFVQADGVEHQVQRLYWPRRDAQVVWMEPVQRPLLG